jgi:antitoxin component YwqK of YwqJK toxin-antitoxin module
MGEYMKIVKNEDAEFTLYWLDGVLCRTNGTVTVCYDGDVRFKFYLNKDSKCHREDGPATTSYYTNGNIMYESYHIDNKLHRIDGPAYISYYSDGSIKSECYRINDFIHRENGPAVINYNEDGYIQEQEYYIHGIRLDPFQILVLQSIE